VLPEQLGRPRIEGDARPNDDGAATATPEPTLFDRHTQAGGLVAKFRFTVWGSMVDGCSRCLHPDPSRSVAAQGTTDNLHCPLKVPLATQ